MANTYVKVITQWRGRAAGRRWERAGAQSAELLVNDLERQLAYDAMAVKSLQDCTLEQEFRRVLGVVTVSSFELTHVRISSESQPARLIVYGVTAAQG